MRLNVNNAKVCPHCDTIYNSELCPVCLSKFGEPLRTWLQPKNHVDFGGEYHVCKTFPDTIQKKQEGVSDDIDMHNNAFNFSDLGHSSVNNQGSRLDNTRFSQSHCGEKQSESLPGDVNHQSRKLMAPQNSVEQRSLGAHAGHACMDSSSCTLRNPIQERPTRSREKHFGGLLRIKSAFERGVTFAAQSSQLIFRSI